MSKSKTRIKYSKYARYPLLKYPHMNLYYYNNGSNPPKAAIRLRNLSYCCSLEGVGKLAFFSWLFHSVRKVIMPQYSSNCRIASGISSAPHLWSAPIFELFLGLASNCFWDLLGFPLGQDLLVSGITQRSFYLTPTDPSYKKSLGSST